MAFFRQRESRSASPDFSLVFPAYNPGPRLAESLSQIDDFLKRTSDVWEFVFVLDGCTDDSEKLLRKWRSTITPQIIGYAPNRGKGYAVRQGLIAANAPHRIFTDIDLAYSFDDIERVANALRSGMEVAIASRCHAESRVTMPAGMAGYAFRRSIQSFMFSNIVRALLPLKNADTQAGLKGFSARVVKEIVPRLTCDGFGIDCEMLTACVRFGVAISEVPVHVRYDSAASTTNFRSTLKMIRELWSVRRTWQATIIPPATESMRYREAG